MIFTHLHASLNMEDIAYNLWFYAQKAKFVDYFSKKNKS